MACSAVIYPWHLLTASAKSSKRIVLFQVISSEFQTHTSLLEWIGQVEHNPLTSKLSPSPNSKLKQTKTNYIVSMEDSHHKHINDAGVLVPIMFSFGSHKN